MPHENVWTRLGVSNIDGIGVFAICDIPAGTDVFPRDSAPLRWIERSAIEAAKLSPQQRAFYDDFAVWRDGRVGCPENFGMLTPGWYLNEPRAGEAANVRGDADCTMIAARDIAAGEELTVRYDSFSRR